MEKLLAVGTVVFLVWVGSIIINWAENFFSAFLEIGDILKDEEERTAK